MGVVIVAACATRRLRPADIFAPDQDLRRPVLAATAAIVAWFSSAVFAGDRTGAVAEAARVFVVLLFLAFTWAVSSEAPAQEERLAWVALTLVVVCAGAMVLGFLSHAVGARVFEQNVQHVRAARLPRFRAFFGHPMACGSALLLAAGMVSGLPLRWLRRMALTIAFALVVATLSLATLVLPVVAALTMVRRRIVRVVVAGVAALCALACLWCNPLRIGFGSRTVIEQVPQQGYERGGLGPRHMPIHDWTIGPVSVSFHVTGYALLAARAVSCAREHPFGVGGRNFVRACPVWAMSTLGGWSERRSAHNSYGALLVEGGMPAAIITVALVVLLARRFRIRSERRLAWAVVVAYLLDGFGGASLYQFAFMALLATTVQRRDPPSDHPVATNSSQSAPLPE